MARYAIRKHLTRDASAVLVAASLTTIALALVLGSGFAVLLLAAALVVL